MKTITIGTVLSDGMNDYTVDRHLGRGGFANVYHAVCNGKEYAVKAMTDDDEIHLQSIKNEFEIAKKVVSEHAIHYLYLNEHGQNGFPCFIIMEFANEGSLDGELKRRSSYGKHYSNEELYDIYTQLIDGMLDISNVAVHRDIKPQNILISNRTYKISDYGLAKYAQTLQEQRR